MTGSSLETAQNEQLSVSVEGVLLATLTPISPYFEPAASAVAADRSYILSRFAYIHTDGGVVVLESPLSHARILLHDVRATAIVHLLAQPRRLEEISGAMSLSSPSGASPLSVSKAIGRMVGLLLTARMASALTDSGSSAEHKSVALKSWEFHDLLFHSQSRAGRHDHAAGGTYRFLGQLEPLPPVKSISSNYPIALERPDLSRLEHQDPPFAYVQETRRSIRDYGVSPLTIQQLAEFLYRVGRVADYWSTDMATPRGTVLVTSAPRPYPAGGGLYELELYLVVNRCEGLEVGFYHYDPEGHQLDSPPASPADREALLADASQATLIAQERLQVLIIIAARFQRVAWKYTSIAYSLILKDVGVLYQTMYLAATAMNLAPCAIGYGNADLFSRAAGTDYYAETSVGEFLVGSRAD